MVFQSYALYPHMTVYQNMAFGLENIGTSQGRDRTSVSASAAKLLRLDTLLQRKPTQLSGGQRQRVAIGRSIVREPKIFLFDEPLSNLDAELRVSMRGEISALHRRLRRTSIYVTHDQVEAMTMADKIVVLRARPHRAGRLAARAVQPAGEPLRRRLHRLAADELRGRVNAAADGTLTPAFGGSVRVPERRASPPARR